MKTILIIIAALLMFDQFANAQSVLNRFGAKAPAEGVFRNCAPTIDCTPTFDCSTVRGSECNISFECRRCQSLLGSRVCMNDPSCEASKSIARAQCEAQIAARKADCEVNKSLGKINCERNTTQTKLSCEAMRNDEISRANKEVRIFNLDAPPLGVQPLKTTIPSEGIIASALDLQDLSRLDFVFVAPDNLLHAMAAQLRYGQSLIPKSAVPELFWIGPEEAKSNRNLTILAYEREILVRDIVRSAIVSELFRMRPEELAQLKASTSFDIGEFVNQATDRLCGDESLLDKGLDCKKAASFRR
jgi:hypothetical protein